MTNRHIITKLGLLAIIGILAFSSCVPQKKMLLPQMLPQMYSFLETLTNATTEQAVELKMIFHEGVVMAGTALATIPLLIMYFILQRRFIQGIERTGLVE